MSNSNIEPLQLHEWITAITQRPDRRFKAGSMKLGDLKLIAVFEHLPLPIAELRRILDELQPRSVQ